MNCKKILTTKNFKRRSQTNFTGTILESFFEKISSNSFFGCDALLGHEGGGSKMATKFRIKSRRFHFEENYEIKFTLLPRPARENTLEFVFTN